MSCRQDRRRRAPVEAEDAPCAGAIRPIDEASVRRICAGQAVTDLASAVKELIDNALDAKSQTINSKLWHCRIGSYNTELTGAFNTVRLFDQGMRILEVSDDGAGVPKESRPLLATLHATSKIAAFDDVYQTSSLGFRGEALFSLANCSSKLIVATRTADEDLAQKLEFLPGGSIDESATAFFPKKVGTTVAVMDLFSALPVRRQDLIRRLPAQRTRLVELVSAYAIFHPGVKIHLMDMVGAHCRESTIVATTLTARTLSDTVSAVLGSKFLSSMCDFGVDLSAVLGESSCLSGLLAKAHTAPERGQRDRQIFCLNGRPVELPGLARALNAAWKILGGNRRPKPSCVLRLDVPSGRYDVNLSPDKRQVLLEHEEEICKLVTAAANTLWASQTEGAFESANVLTGDVDYVDYESPAQSDSETHDVDASPSRFNRRYAFCRDLSKAKLQHEFDDGRTKFDDPEDNSKETVKDRSPPAEEQQTQSSRSDEHQIAAEGSIGSDTEVQLKNAELGMVSLGRRKRLRIQTSEVDATTKSVITPSPAEHQSTDHESPPALLIAPLESGPSSAETSQFQALQRSFNYDLDEDDPQLSFDQFQSATTQQSLVRHGFSKKTASPPKGDELNEQLFGAASRQEDAEKQFSPRLKRSIGGEPKQGALVNGTTEKVNEDDANLSIRIDGKQGDESVHAAAPSETTQEPVVWDEFKGTPEVILAARRERLAMRDRKRRLCRPSDTENSNTLENAQDPNQSNLVHLTKDDFSNMSVIGQFNLGFILATTPDNNLWILDQHACDEKYNFEKLCSETIIHEQRLLSPLPLELTPAEETCVMDHLDIFERNGFRFAIDLDKPPRHRLSLTGLPHSGARDGRKAVQFGQEDVSALCGMLGVDETSHDGAAGAGTDADGSGAYGNNAVRRYASSSSNGETADKLLVRLPKAIAMFASRACRGSIMIGKALSKVEMDRVVKRLGDIKNPWNCPHGRPTMRHVGNLHAELQKDGKAGFERVSVATATMPPATQEAFEDTLS